MLEAMACGVPVITSNTSSMPEVSGDAAYLADPYNPALITGAMVEIMNDQNLRKKMVEKGLVQAARFSWRQMATDVKDIYQAIHNETKAL